jgi:hypothetical protein
MSEYYITNKTNLDNRHYLIKEIDKEMTDQLLPQTAPNPKNFYASIRYNRRVYLINQCQIILRAHKSPVVCHWVKAMTETFKKVNQMDLPLATNPILIDALRNNKLITVSISER